MSQALAIKSKLVQFVFTKVNVQGLLELCATHPTQFPIRLFSEEKLFCKELIKFLMPQNATKVTG